MNLLTSDFLVAPVSIPSIAAHNWKMCRERGFFGYWKDLAISIIIPVTGAGLTGAALAIIEKIAIDIEMPKISERCIAPCCIGIMGASTFGAQKAYCRTSSWITKSLIMHLHGAAMLLSVPLTSQLHAGRVHPLHQKRLEEHKASASLIASSISIVVSMTMICLSVNPIWSSAAGNAAFVVLSTIFVAILQH